WPVDVVYRRTDRDRLTGPDGKPTPFSELLLPAMCKGRLAVFNAFGTGIADDKLAHAYVEEMIRFYLAEEPVLPSVETFDLGEPDQLADALDRLDDLVVKERSGEGGYGVTIWSQSAPERRESVLRELRRRPHEFVAQERILLSTHPTVIDGGLAPRHVDLRPFTLTAGRDVSVIPGGLTRVAFGAGALVVNSSQNGGGKDTWVLT
ncbi:MAG: hypothetical protein QOJ07_1176, partial [Thermoleophilaceae bacterium]|nr:hypothetical protein [Thermoleophilaceae bacterium]